jgi:multiple sugar transport system permease protein
MNDDVTLSIRQMDGAWRLMCAGAPKAVEASGEGIQYIFSGLPVSFFNVALLTGSVDLTAFERLTPRSFLNSLVFTVVIVLGQGTVTTMGGFAFARLRFRFRDALFLAYLGTMMIPFQVTMIPTFIIVARLGWQDTYQGLIVPILAQGAFGTFLFRQFFMSIPEELGDAATVDGANPFQIFYKIYLPLSSAALTAYGVITTLGAWNMYLWPLIVTQSKELRTLTLVIAQFSGTMNQELHLLMAAVTICLIPVFVAYAVGQRFFVEGIAMTGLKG